MRSHQTILSRRRAAASFNHTMQRMRASRSGQSQLLRLRRLARTADGDRSAVV